jgi:hypothetical protein
VALVAALVVPRGAAAGTVPIRFDRDRPGRSTRGALYDGTKTTVAVTKDA